jgi:hypothetical protein
VAEEEKQEKRTDHCDDYVLDHTAPFCLRWWLFVNRLPAIYGSMCKKAGVKPELYADYKGKRVRVVMASRLGDVGITEDLGASSSYQTRVQLKDLCNFSGNCTK